MCLIAAKLPKGQNNDCIFRSVASSIHNSNFGIKNIRFNRSVSVGLIARFIVSPAIFLVIVSLLPISSLAKNVFTVQAFMPVMASQTIIARRYNVDDQYPAVMVAISTLLSLIIIPLVKVCIV